MAPLSSCCDVIFLRKKIALGSSGQSLPDGHMVFKHFDACVAVELGDSEFDHCCARYAIED